MEARKAELQRLQEEYNRKKQEYDQEDDATKFFDDVGGDIQEEW